MSDVSGLGIKSIYKVYWMSGGAPPMNVSPECLYHISSQLLIGHRLPITASDWLDPAPLGGCLSACQLRVCFNSR